MMSSHLSLNLGDSGSCIWDMKGRPAGILMAGNGSGLDDMHDVTYATPFGLLLADIKAHGFDVSLVQGAFKHTLVHQRCRHCLHPNRVLYK